jgi:hypothetical protein
MHATPTNTYSGYTACATYEMERYGKTMNRSMRIFDEIMAGARR